MVGRGGGDGEKVKLQKGAEKGERSLAGGNTRKSWSLASENKRMVSGQWGDRRDIVRVGGRKVLT